jgi:hypothetical protein
MKFTVDTSNKTVTINSSVKYEEVKELRQMLSEFVDNYTWLVPLDVIEEGSIKEFLEPSCSCVVGEKVPCVCGAAPPRNEYC